MADLLDLMPVRHPLRELDMLDPRLFNRSPRELRAPVKGGAVEVCGTRFQFIVASIAEGAEVEVHITRHGPFALRVDEVTAYERALAEDQEARRIADEQRMREQADRDSRAAWAANKALGLPFRWSAAYRAVMAGLRASSSCTGEYALTVTHVRCDEPVALGRLRREADRTLCGGPTERMWLVDDRGRDGSGTPYDRKITCKACLAVAARIAARVATEAAEA